MPRCSAGAATCDGLRRCAFWHGTVGAWEGGGRGLGEGCTGSMGPGPAGSVNPSPGAMDPAVTGSRAPRPTPGPPPHPTSCNGGGPAFFWWRLLSLFSVLCGAHQRHNTDRVVCAVCRAVGQPEYSTPAVGPEGRGGGGGRWRRGGGGNDCSC